ncbi:MAG: NUDIX domain-containing protein [Chloroflexi bacterium]|nr:NUDIX domain-containing protein [Chloroflexota bacterium]
MGAKDQGADAVAVADRWQVVPRTLCFVTYGEEILLLKRAQHKRVYPGYYNGLGGHIERDEDPLRSAIREIREESGLEVTQVRYCGTTHIDAGQATGILLFIFTAVASSREVHSGDEGTLHWLRLTDVLRSIHSVEPELPLVEDLPLILPRIFEDGRIPFFAHVSYDDADRLRFRLAE